MRDETIFLFLQEIIQFMHVRKYLCFNQKLLPFLQAVNSIYALDFFLKKYLCAWFNCMLQYVAGILSDEQKRWVQVEGLFAEVDLNIPDFLKRSDPPTSDHMNFMRNWKYFHKS